ncbi:MAG: ABC transporter permease [Candidatus Adiutrix sp.]|nr:ABC transporter permease [Candidatus Adiutrix sp.]
MKHYRREWLFSVCAVFSLAAFLTPLLTLMGVKDGVIGALTARLIDNPRNLELSPAGTGQFGDDFFKALREHPAAAFVIAETRSIAATIQLEKAGAAPIWVGLSATAPGDPLLAGGAEAESAARPDRLSGLGSVFVSEAVAEKMVLAAGDTVRGTVSRRAEGRLETASTELTVMGVVPRYVVSRDLVFCPLALMEMTEDYRNGFAAPALGWAGREKPEIAPRYAGFRLYAKDLDSVEVLRRFLAARGLEVYTRAEDIAVVRSLDHSFAVVFFVLAVVVGTGAFASAASSALDQAAKMRRSLAVLRLLGLSGGRLSLFSMFQAALTGILAALAADALFLGIAAVLNDYFGPGLGFGERVCWLPPWKLAAAVGLSFIFMVGASSVAAFSLAGIEPSEGMRDV